MISRRRPFAARTALACVTAIWFVFASYAFAAAHSPAANIKKTLYVAFEAPETGFDPAAVSDHYSLEVIHNIFEPLLSYDYLARPQKLVPGTTTALPQIADGGRTFVFKIQPGIYFADDPAFGGKKRELTAADYVYSLQRL